MNEEKNLNRERLWTKYYILMMIVDLLISGTNFILLSTLPLYILNIGGNDSIIGLATGVFTIAALLFRPFAGHLLDTVGRKKVLLIGLIILIVVFLIYNRAYSIVVLLILRIINGFGFSAFSTASITVVSDIVPKSRLSEGIGFFGISSTLASAIGPALGLYVVKQTNYSTLFMIILAFGVLALIIVQFINYEGNIKRNIYLDDGIHKQLEVTKSSFIEKTAIFPAIVMIFLAICLGVIVTFMPVYGEARLIDNIGLFYTVNACSVFIIRLITGKLVDRYGIFRVLVAGFGILFISQILLAFGSTLLVVLVAGVLFGTGFGLAQPILSSIVIRLCLPTRRGAANATFLAAMDIGVGLGAMIFGVILQAFNFTLVLLGTSVSIIIAGIIFYFVLWKKIKVNN